MEVPRFMCADPAFLPPSSLYFITTGANQAFSPPSLDSRVQIRLFCPVDFHGGCPELRQGPAQLRVLRNSPRAMPLFGYELVRPELTCKESILLRFH